ncbi:M15 family metallopeptidase [Collimonas pratensis]|uniref:D-alanyl-D-alanine carboxypeptidase family protein n=1 Tax=Collimonas pratensis TaxID=279113 RepID=A0ABN4MBE1_9BURK|nr:M15 family metallopeptidase [Collimonas pratensis]AMP14885.1 D-alanyl-D-alanine carboxypeptidase family protein [Collimonas pratensis]
MSSRSLDDLLPDVAVKAKAFIASCQAAGIQTVVACTYRTDAEQTTLYAQGRTAPGPIVTDARAGQSLHNVRRALDVYPLVNGKLCGLSTQAERDLWEKLGQLGEAAGFEWAGRWVHFREYPHFQIKG